MSKRTSKLLLASALLVGASAVNATSIVYNDFSDTTGLQLNGSAAILTPNSDNVLRLTQDGSQSGSAFSTDAIALNPDMSFSTAFSFNILNSGGFSDIDGIGADGFTFTLQSASNTAGGNGGGLGYMGINNSLGIEFDTWLNSNFSETDGNHVAVLLNGDITPVAQTNISTRMNNGADWFAWVDYDGILDELEVRLAENNLRPTLSTLSYTVDLSNIINSNEVYAGFTSGTGSAYGQHNILNWQFNSTYNPITIVGQGTIPTPGSLPLILMGLLIVGLRSTLKFKNKH